MWPWWEAFQSGLKDHYLTPYFYTFISCWMNGLLETVQSTIPHVVPLMCNLQRTSLSWTPWLNETYFIVLFHWFFSLLIYLVSQRYDSWIIQIYAVPNSKSYPKRGIITNESFILVLWMTDVQGRYKILYSCSLSVRSFWSVICQNYYGIMQSWHMSLSKW